MFGLLTSILGLFGGGGLSSITGQLAQAYQAKLAAQNEPQRIEAEQRIATLQAKRDVLIAEAGKSRINAFIRAGVAVPVMLYYGKIFLWDKVLAWGSTDPLSDDLQWTARAILGFYFLFEAVNAVRR